jgi:hypothetical protein
VSIVRLKNRFERKSPTFYFFEVLEGKVPSRAINSTQIKDSGQYSGINRVFTKMGDFLSKRYDRPPSPSRLGQEFAQVHLPEGRDLSSFIGQKNRKICL